MNILIGSVLLVLVSLALWRRLPGDEAQRLAVRDAMRLGRFVLPRIVVALIGAALFAELLPEETIRAMFGDDAGLLGLLIAAIIGPVTPGGPFVCFAIASAGLQAGAEEPIVMAYVTSWSAFALTKTFAFEVPLLGSRFVVWRVLLTLPVPFAVAGVAGMLG